MDDRFIIFGAPDIHEAEINEVVSSLRSGWLGTGPKVELFERRFAAYKRVKYAAALNSCTAALHLSILAAGIQPGDEVITTPLTFCATVNAIIHAGAVPVLADIQPDTMNIDPGQVQSKITPKTKALLPVHFAGRPCDMDALTDIARRYSLKVIEDCAHAVETEYQGLKAGTIGDFGCFSFYVTKNVATGEGGMVITRREKDMARIKVLGLHGMSKDAWKRFSDEGYKHYQVVECGYKYNMMDLQAAIGMHQLARVEQNWRRRKEIWALYNRSFADLPVALPAPVVDGTRHAYHLYTILVDRERSKISRDRFIAAMAERRIGTGVHYRSIAEHSYYRRTFGWRPRDYPRAMRIGRQTVSLPLSAGLSERDVERIVAAVRAILRAEGP